MAAARALRDRIASVSASLSPAQRRVARLVDETPDVVAFGTVAEVAQASGTSPQTVLRLAARLGHRGFPELQDQVRTELVARLPPAAARIRQPPGADVPGGVVAADLDNVATSLDVEPAALDAVIARLVDAPRVAVVAADSWSGIGRLFVDHLLQLRADVELLEGPAPRIARQVAHLGPGDVVVALDVRRYERWMLETLEQVAAQGIPLVAVSDGPTSPLFAHAAHRLVVGIASPGPFESATGVVALLHLLVTEAAARHRDHARDRLDAAEAAWAARGVLLDDA